MEAEGDTTRCGNRVGEGVEGEGASVGEGGSELGRGDEGMGGGVAVLATDEVAIEGRDDGVLLAVFEVATLPLPDAANEWSDLVSSVREKERERVATVAARSGKAPDEKGRSSYSPSSASIRQHRPTGSLERVQDAIASYGCANLLRAGSDEEGRAKV